MSDGPGEYRDELPDDLDATAFVGPYTFPDNKRRRIPGLLYVAAGALLLVLWWSRGSGVLVNEAFAVLGVALIAGGAYHWAAGYPLDVDESHALAAAARAAGFPVGHASAQLGWRGLRSRPTWRILLYSADEPPSKRGLVLVDAVDGSVVDQLVEDNPEDWSAYTAKP